MGTLPSRGPLNSDILFELKRERGRVERIWRGQRSFSRTRTRPTARAPNAHATSTRARALSCSLPFALVTTRNSASRWVNNTSGPFSFFFYFSLSSSCPEIEIFLLFLVHLTFAKNELLAKALRTFFGGDQFCLIWKGGRFCVCFRLFLDLRS